MNRTQLDLVVISALCVACTVTGCAAQQKILGRPVQQKVAIVVRISDEVNAADNAGGVAELVQTIADGLKDHGMYSDIYTSADDHPPPPRIELNVVYWSETSDVSRSLTAATAVALPLGIAGGIVGPDNRMVVDCAVVLDSSGQRLFWQRITAGKALHMGDPDEASAGGNAGSQILGKILKR
jgi:hypothetical protein